MTDTITLKQAVDIVLEGFTLPDAARKILETAYFAEAALAQQEEQAGWVRDPVRPTQEMIDAGDGVEDLYRRGTQSTWVKVYRAMLAAAPMEVACK